MTLNPLQTPVVKHNGIKQQNIVFLVIERQYTKGIKIEIISE